MLQLKKFLCIKTINNALVAESVDAADLKSVARKGVPVQVWPSAPNETPPAYAGGIILGQAKLVLNLRVLDILYSAVSLPHLPLRY